MDCRVDWYQYPKTTSYQNFASFDSVRLRGFGGGCRIGTSRDQSGLGVASRVAAESQGGIIVLSTCLRSEHKPESCRWRRRRGRVNGKVKGREETKEVRRVEARKEKELVGRCGRQ